jgi:tetratricopeptide (TPR) repeat protein
MSQVILAIPILVVLAYQEPAHPSPADLRSFDRAKVEAGKDPAKLVKLALWCEAHGLRDQRRAVLEEAVRIDPNHTVARGLLNQVSYQRHWEAPEAVSRQMKDDEALMAKLAEYNARRDRIDRDTEIERRLVARYEQAGNHAKAGEVKLALDRRIAPEHVRLGLWCEKNGLKAEALAHFTTALQLNPHNEATWRHLGYVQHHGRWMSHEQIAAEAREAQAQKHADRHWEAMLQRWVGELRVPRRRGEAETNLAKVSDPRAVPAIVRLLGAVSPASQKLAVRLLGQIDSSPSSRHLAEMSAYGDNPEVQEAAARALKGRDPRDYAEWLVGLIHTPMTYEVKPVAGPGSQGFLVIDTPRFRITRTYDAPSAFTLGTTFHGYVGYDAFGLPVVLSGADVDKLKGKHGAEVLHEAEVHTAQMLADAQAKAVIANERLTADVREVEQLNAMARWQNRHVEGILRIAMDAPSKLGDDDEDAWRSWYYERIGYSYTPPPKVVAAVNAVPQLAAPVIVDCFAAGTPVRTIEGPRPIESIRTGDQVLSRDVVTGALAFQPVLAVHHNSQDQTLRIALENGDAVVTSRFHRFWLASRGWAMARDLKVGDVVRTLDGPVRIRSVEEAPVQPIFNLDVAQFRTYFVGNSAMLVHDNTRTPSHSIAPPFDRVAEPAIRP